MSRGYTASRFSDDIDVIKVLEYLMNGNGIRDDKEANKHLSSLRKRAKQDRQVSKIAELAKHYGSKSDFNDHFADASKYMLHSKSAYECCITPQWKELVGKASSFLRPEDREIGKPIKPAYAASYVRYVTENKIKLVKCECGGETVGGGHSSWCPKAEVRQ